MGLFDVFKKKKPVELSPEAMKWNRMFDMWSDGKLDSPYNELVGYYGEVLNGGHYFYFSNTECNDDLEKVVSILTGNLPEILRENLVKAYGFYKQIEKEPNEENAERLCKELYAYDIFYEENEKLLEAMLQEYANSL